MNNYGDLGGCYPPPPTTSTDNTLLDLHNSSYDTQPHSLVVNYATVGIEKLTFGIHHELVIYYFHNLDWFWGVIFG